MKTTLLTLLFALAVTAYGQNTAQPNAGARHAWGDKNKDGICDVTGKPVGQGRAQAQGQAGGQRMGRGRRGMRGMRNCCARNQAPAAAPEAKK